MAERRHDEEVEINFVALMDTMTNVVGVLLIVLVMVGISIANSVRKVMSELPMVDEQQLKEIQEQRKNVTPAFSLEELEKQIEEARKKLAESESDLKTLDTEASAMNVTITKLQELEKQIAEKKKERDSRKTEVDALIAKLEHIKDLLAETPAPKPVDATYVRLPNPRPYPENPDVTRVYVAKPGVVFFNENEFLAPVYDYLKKNVRSIQYGQNPNANDFKTLLVETMGSEQEAAAAWPMVSAFIDKYQAEQVALVFKALTEIGVKVDRNQIERVADLAAAINRPMSLVANAIAAATKGDYTLWTELDPSADKLKPAITATAAGNQVTFSFHDKKEEVRANPRDILKYFDDLGDSNGVKGRTKDRVIYDSKRIIESLDRVKAFAMSMNEFDIKATPAPDSNLVRLDIVPKGGSGVPVTQFGNQQGGLQRKLLDIKKKSNGIVLFQIVTDAVETYLKARTVSDELEIPATWDMIGALDIKVNINGYEIQRQARVPVSRPSNTPPPKVQIRAPERGLD